MTAPFVALREGDDETTSEVSADRVLEALERSRLVHRVMGSLGSLPRRLARLPRVSCCGHALLIGVYHAGP